MQPEKDIYAIIAAHFNGQTTPAEAEILSSWLSASERNVQEYNELEDIWTHSSVDTLPEPKAEALWNGIAEQLFNPTVQTKKKTSLRRIYWVLPIAAALAAAVFITRSLITEPWIEFGTEDIAQSITLPDNSVVWLKPHSQIAYPKMFEERVVKLTGEGFFDVQSNPQAPFRVETAYLETTVLGTEFTVEAYPEDPVHHVTLLEGKVEVRSAQDSVILAPGDALAFSVADKTIATDSIETSNTISWVRKELMFKETPLRQVLEDMQVYYDFELDMPEAPYLDCAFTGTFRENPPIEDILETLAFTLNLEYQWNKETLVIIAARCKQIQ